VRPGGKVRVDASASPASDSRTTSHVAGGQP